MQAQKRGLTIFRPMFSSILGVCDGGSSLSWEEEGEFGPPLSLFVFFSFAAGTENTRNIVVSGVYSSTTDIRVNGAFAFLGKNGQKTLQK